jgi:hypothetical protein
VDDLFVNDDLRAICEFEVMLRNVLAWRDRGRQVMRRHGDGGAGIDPAMLDQTLHEVQRLVDAVATVRELLDLEQAAPAPGQRLPGSTPRLLSGSR